ncbi:hypothetical protein P6N53_07200 [Desulforamulus aquiferis]|uniref:Anti-bacteriophage protein A/HamA C-terminal domain-containing protein n=2 Tax=Desulforamulus aquiferis TaxID=1397668 RepID=A0AAW7ZCN2_9FIRM|nr:hypothetical protein [Desulforamulus aquiferis]
MSKFGKITSCNVYVIHVEINDINDRAQEMIDIISDNSWVNKLKPIESKTFEARAKRTIKKLVNDIFLRINNPLSTEFGEYLISYSAVSALEECYQHHKVPLAELLKEKVTGNPGFDFHTETNTMLIAFGEAKYSGSTNPYVNALSQIAKFIALEKDVAEFAILQHFVSSTAMENALNGNKAFTAAFSINTQQPNRIFTNALKSTTLEQLLAYEELYLIGVEICAK